MGSEVVGRETGVSCAAAAQGFRRFWKRTSDRAEIRGLVKALLDKLSNG